MVPPIMRCGYWGAGNYSVNPNVIQQVREAENAVDSFTLAFLQNAAPCALACALGLILLEGRQLVRASRCAVCVPRPHCSPLPQEHVLPSAPARTRRPAVQACTGALAYVSDACAFS